MSTDGMPASDLTVIGTVVSPYVRKVLAVCELKGLGYRLDPVIAFLADDEFTRVSPLRRIPVLRDGAVTIADSSVICQYLEDRYPEPSVYPRDVAARAHARWLEEYADTLLGDLLIWRIFTGAVIAPSLLGRTRDEAAIERALQELPPVMDYLEGVAPETGFAAGSTPSVGDVSVAVFFANLRWSRTGVDLSRWPRTAAWLERVDALPAMRRLGAVADAVVRTRPSGQREVYEAHGIALTDDTVTGDGGYRAGPLTVDALRAD